MQSTGSALEQEGQRLAAALVEADPVNGRRIVGVQGVAHDLAVARGQPRVGGIGELLEGERHGDVGSEVRARRELVVTPLHEEPPPKARSGATIAATAGSSADVSVGTKNPASSAPAASTASVAWATRVSAAAGSAGTPKKLSTQASVVGEGSPRRGDDAERRRVAGVPHRPHPLRAAPAVGERVVEVFVPADAELGRGLDAGRARRQQGASLVDGGRLEELERSCRSHEVPSIRNRPRTGGRRCEWTSLPPSSLSGWGRRRLGTGRPPSQRICLRWAARSPPARRPCTPRTSRASSRRACPSRASCSPWAAAARRSASPGRREANAAGATRPGSRVVTSCISQGLPSGSRSVARRSSWRCRAPGPGPAAPSAGMPPGLTGWKTSLISTPAARVSGPPRCRTRSGTALGGAGRRRRDPGAELYGARRARRRELTTGCRWRRGSRVEPPAEPT